MESYPIWASIPVHSCRAIYAASTDNSVIVRNAGARIAGTGNAQFLSVGCALSTRIGESVDGSSYNMNLNGSGLFGQ